MPSILTPLPIISKGIYMLGLLDIDADPLAERYVVLDRVSLSVLRMGAVPATGLISLLLPVKYSDVGVIVAILDDDKTYNIKAADGVTFPLVDVNTI